jgi:hypothetical protein
VGALDGMMDIRDRHRRGQNHIVIRRGRRH